MGKLKLLLILFFIIIIVLVVGIALTGGTFTKVVGIPPLLLVLVDLSYKFGKLSNQ